MDNTFVKALKERVSKFNPVESIRSMLGSKTYSYDFREPTAPATTAPVIQQAMQQRAQPTVAPVVAPVGALGRNPDLPKKPMSDQVKNAILTAAKEFNVPSQLLFDIAYSESGFRPDAANETPEGQAVGVPRGVFQFTPGTWDSDLKNYANMPGSSLTNWNNPDRNDPAANSRAAAYLIKNGQLARWDASMSNWGRFYNDDEIADYYSQSPGHSKKRK